MSCSKKQVEPQSESAANESTVTHKNDGLASESTISSSTGVTGYIKNDTQRASSGEFFSSTDSVSSNVFTLLRIVVSPLSDPYRK